MRIVERLSQFLNCEKPAIVTEKETISYSQLFQYSLSMSKTILEKTEPEDVNIGLYLKDNAEYIIGYLALLLSEKCIVPIRTDLTGKSVKNLLDKANARWVITDCDTSVSGINIISFAKISLNIQYASSPGERHDVLLLGSSGTTDRSQGIKLVRINEENIDYVIQSYTDILKLDQFKDPVFWIMAPLQSSFGNYVFLSCLCTCTTIYLNDHFLPWTFQNIIINKEITHIECITTFLFTLLKINRGNEWGKLKYVGFGGESAGRDEMLSLLERFPGIELSQGYGLTEASPLITIFPPKLSVDNPSKYIEKIMSVGRVLPGINVKICKTADEHYGEILVAGPNITAGYYGEEDWDIFENGYLKTGDVGYIDEDNYLYVLGRIKNIAIIEGKNVQIEEVEHVIRTNPYVKEARILVEKDEYMGERLCAEVILLDDVAEIDLKGYLYQRLEDYKVPSEIRYVKEIYKTGGKVKRK